MYKTAHDISIYNLVQCEQGDLSYLGRGIFKKRRLKKIQDEILSKKERDRSNDDFVVKLNWIETMRTLCALIDQSVFGTEEQKKEIEAMAQKLGLSLDSDRNRKVLQKYIDWVMESAPKKPDEPKKESKNTPLDDMYAGIAYISMSLNIGRLDPKEVSAAEFTRLAELTKQKSKAQKEQQSKRRKNGK